MNIGQLITGTILTLGGIILAIIAILNGFKNGSFVALIYGIPILVIGIFILLNKKEDHIEPIKKMKGGKK